MATSGTNPPEVRVQRGDGFSGRIAGWMLFLLIALVAYAAIRMLGDTANGPSSPAVGKTLESLVLAPLTGNARPITGEDLRGKVTLVNFWGYWCGPCAIEFPHMLALRSELSGEPDFQFVSVSCHAQPTGDERLLRERTHVFLDHLRGKLPSPDYLEAFATHSDLQAETRRALADAAGLESLPFPATLLIDRQGLIRGLWLGYSPADPARIKSEVSKWLLAD